MPCRLGTGPLDHHRKLALNLFHPSVAAQDLSNDIGVPYNLLWTIDGAQNGPALMSGALDVQQDGWVAWGFPESPGSGMLGGSALLVKTDPGLPSGAHSATTVTAYSTFPFCLAGTGPWNLTKSKEC